jgi:hypothetical protein
MYSTCCKILRRCRHDAHPQSLWVSFCSKNKERLFPIIQPIFDTELLFRWRRNNICKHYSASYLKRGELYFWTKKLCTARGISRPTSCNSEKKKIHFLHSVRHASLMLDSWQHVCVGAGEGGGEGNKIRDWFKCVCNLHTEDGVTLSVL